jgi:hypothetical protein
MKINFLLKLSLILMLVMGATFSQAQDSVRKTVVKKTIVKPAVPAAAVKPGAIPINPKTGRPYSKYGYGTYAKTYQATQKADTVKKSGTLQTPTTSSIATIPITTPPTAGGPPITVDKSLNGQYQYLLTKVYNYQKPFVDAMWKNFTDTLKSTHGQLKAANDKVAEQNKTIAGLQANVAAKEQTLSQTDTISFLGISLSKTAYNIVMWGLVIVIGLVAGVVIAQSGGYRKEAVHRTTLYNELEEEFKAYKSKTNEKEKKLARELQTERNKVDELMGRG